MKDQIIPIDTRYPSFVARGRAVKTMTASYPDAAFWMQVYQPMSDVKTQDGFRSVCPWGMAAELTDGATLADRRKNILDSLKTGLKTIRQYDLPAYRIQFMEHRTTREISVWVH
jgi:vancomycin resistance protein YoaR